MADNEGRTARKKRERAKRARETCGQLVALGFGVSTFAPAPYRRHRL